MPTPVVRPMANRSTSICVLLALTIVSMALASTAGPAQAAAKHHHAQVSPSVVARTTALLRDSIKTLSTRSGPRDQEFFANGVWRSPDTTIWSYNLGPGTAAAVLWRATGSKDERLRRLAVQTFTTVISQRRNPNGSFGSADDSPDINSMMAGVELGTAYLELKPTLGPKTEARWREAVTGAAD